ncbi:tetratricopeptide repeat protein [Flavobacterium terrisoli]|uniref:tetratricopeptide repeat protein n=1 Tax=Flavobacterium terrisoli TaxID=3242195 RepID=UPI0025436B33|nr:hypothetical protein [Flavobacterium buctense]
MKAIFSLIGILFITGINAQKFDCSSTIAAYQELIKAKDFSGAFESWSNVRKNCPKQSETVYTDGVKIIQYKIDNAANAEEKETLVRDVMKLYDQYNKNFPLTTTDFEISKAMALHDNKIDAKEEILSLLDSGFSKATGNINNANAIYTYFSLCYEKYKAGDKKFTTDYVLEKYTLANSMLTQLQDGREKADDYKTAQRAIITLAKDLTSCENLAAYYEKGYELNKDNNDWLTSALNSLSARCSSKPIFITMAQKLYAVKATPKSAYFMALANLRQRKFEEAIKFYNESADLETIPQEKAKIYYTLATGLLANDMTKSKESLNKALKADPKMGRAYLFLAQLYSNADQSACGKTEFEKKAIYYLAIQTAKKATVAEPKLKAASDKIEQDLANKTLTPADIKTAKMNGKSVTIGCWINETITFPAQ